MNWTLADMRPPLKVRFENDTVAARNSFARSCFLTGSHSPHKLRLMSGLGQLQECCRPAERVCKTPNKRQFRCIAEDACPVPARDIVALHGLQRRANRAAPKNVE
jgi:hypothetical protein